MSEYINYPEMPVYRLIARYNELNDSLELPHPEERRLLIIKNSPK